MLFQKKTFFEIFKMILFSHQLSASMGRTAVDVTVLIFAGTVGDVATKIMKDKSVNPMEVK